MGSLKSASKTILGLVVVGLVISALYDLLVKPGLSTLGRFVLDVFTFGSQMIKDATYESAALDPTPITPLLIVIVCLGFFTAPLLVPIMRPIERWMARKITKALVLENRSRHWILWSVLLCWTIGALIGFAMHNQSIVIWRVFHAEMRIVAPYISPGRSTLLFSRFSQMQTEADFRAIRAELRAIAQGNQVELMDYETW